jgi:hypothetical protein
MCECTGHVICRTGSEFPGTMVLDRRVAGKGVDGASIRTTVALTQQSSQVGNTAIVITKQLMPQFEPPLL